MASRARAREILDRSRVMFGRSRVVAADLLDPQRRAVPKAIEAAPSAPAAPAVTTATDGALVEVCASIALRDLNLIDTLLSDLEAMERGEEDSARLSQLYRLDHLAARLRRNAENLRVLADRDADEDGGTTISVLDTVRGAMSSIDQYAKVGIGHMVPLGVAGFGANDLSRVLAELLDNAAAHSPPGSDVRVSAHLTERGSVLIRIEDDGIGLPADRLAELNTRLTSDQPLDDAAVRHMGLAVVRRLAERHGLGVSLDHRVPRGTTAGVVVPPSLITDLPEDTWSGRATVPARRGAQVPEEDVPVLAGVNGVSAGAGGAAAELPRRSATAPTPRLAPEPTARPKATAPPKETAPPKPTLPSSPAIDGTTDSGLPRRVSRSIKPDTPDVVPAPAGDGVDLAGADQFLADLDGFTDGEAAARAQDDPDAPTPGAPTPDAPAQDAPTEDGDTR
ncbi:ATP-binding protein [Pseudonocardia nematodicida]|uniref:histidine kinase n=1 Tax=Pseudonocardia nematodicida TaxID=1206997 RepID=A0ABV1K858_9PSEU